MIQIERTTKETSIRLELELQGSGQGEISTGVGFFDHMLHSFAVHGGFDLSVQVQGDLQVDCHHTIEDTGIVLGQAFAKALGNKGGIRRFGSAYVPMDEALCFAAVDVSGRPYLVLDCPASAPMIGEYDTQMTTEFFRALAMNSGITLHARCLYGDNDHHKVEALFKAVARALREAVTPTGDGRVLSAKGVLG
ncbi:MAG: imidazoleglycerol-phosphate dehydratase HisB [Eubacteriales bacterium]|jgi:imidazoleglycerol-phosphate dehydratase